MRGVETLNPETSPLFRSLSLARSLDRSPPRPLPPSFRPLLMIAADASCRPLVASLCKQMPDFMIIMTRPVAITTGPRLEQTQQSFRDISRQVLSEYPI